MSKITLEDVARYIDDIVEAHQLNGVQTFTPQMEPAMALVRAAAKVVEAAREIKLLSSEGNQWIYGKRQLDKSLATFDKAGEKP